MKSTLLVKKTIKKTLNSPDWTVARWAREVGVTRFTINSWLRNDISKIKLKYLERIALVIGLELKKTNGIKDDWEFVEKTPNRKDNVDLIDDTFRSIGTIPVIDNFNKYYIDSKSFNPIKLASSYIFKPAPISDHGSYGLVVFDDSMYPKFRKGDLIIASPEKYYSNDCYAVVVISGQINICHITKRKNKFIISKFNDSEFYKTRSELKMCHPIVWTKEF